MTLPVKLCCMRNRVEVDLAIRSGANILGFVGEQPSGPGRLEDAEIAELIRYADGRARCWLLTSTVEAEALIAQIDLTKPDAVQVCDAIDVAVYAELRRRFPTLQIIQVIHVHGPEALVEAGRLEPHVDALLLDSGITQGPDRQLGGTGQTHDWRLSRALVAAVDLPVWLAGGLRPNNVETAIRQVRPYGVDLCSGVRGPEYALDPDKVSRFMAAVATASEPLVVPAGASLGQLQHYVRQLEAHHDWLHLGVVDNGFLMAEEVGELHKALRRLAQVQDDPARVEEVGDEIVDVLNYLLAQANRVGIDVEEAFRRKNTRNLNRTWP